MPGGDREDGRSHTAHTAAGGGASYVGGGEGEHGEEDDGQLGLRHPGADSRQDGHDGARLRRQPIRLEEPNPAAAGLPLLLTAPSEGPNLPVASLQV